MEISALSIKIIMLLIPGAIAALVNEKLTLRPKHQTPFKFIIASILFGVMSYVGLQVVLLIIHLVGGWMLECYSGGVVQLEVFRSLSESTSIPAFEIAYASGLAIVLSFWITKVSHKKLLYLWARKLGVSNKYGDESLFFYFSNSPEVEWVYVRYPKNGLTYFGAISAYSEDEAVHELVLSDVTVLDWKFRSN